MTEDEKIEIGARAHFDAAGHIRYGGAAPDWDRHLTERNREQGRAEFRELLSRLREAGLVLVPVEPTEAMVSAGDKGAANANEDGLTYPATALNVYRAMVLAATGDAP